MIYLINDVEAHLLNKDEKESFMFASFVSQSKFQIDKTFKCNKTKKRRRNLRNPRRKHGLIFYYIEARKVWYENQKPEKKKKKVEEYKGKSYQIETNVFNISDRQRTDIINMQRTLRISNKQNTSVKMAK